MKTYEFSFKGLYINPMVIVVAKNKEEATEYAKTKVKSENFDPETVELVGEEKIVNGAIIYFNNGDY